jgi:transcriptional regulator with XRE-family HTH domain
MQFKEKIGARIKALRTEKNITQEAVAYSSNVDRTYMNHVENGKRNVTVETLEKIICEGLDMSIKDFFNAKEFGVK